MYIQTVKYVSLPTTHHQLVGWDIYCEVSMCV